MYNFEQQGFYYDLAADIEIGKKYDCFMYIIIGGRGTGKTYSALRYEVENKRSFIFTKRTNDDIKLMANQKKGAGEKDFSPFKALNRDFHWNIQLHQIEKGIAGFYHQAEYEETEGSLLPFSYAVSMNAIADLRGFDMSDIKDIIFDEFIPPRYARIMNKEGEQFLDLYKTIARDREHRGQEPLRAILLAKANRLYNPIIET